MKHARLSGDPAVDTNWTLLTIIGRNRFSAEGLTALTTYHFRVVANGAAGPSPASMVASALAR